MEPPAGQGPAWGSGLAGWGGAFQGKRVQASLSSKLSLEKRQFHDWNLGSAHPFIHISFRYICSTRKYLNWHFKGCQRTPSGRTHWYINWCAIKHLGCSGRKYVWLRMEGSSPSTWSGGGAPDLNFDRQLPRQAHVPSASLHCLFSAGVCTSHFISQTLLSSSPVVRGILTNPQGCSEHCRRAGMRKCSAADLQMPIAFRLPCSLKGTRCK